MGKIREYDLEFIDSQGFTHTTRVIVDHENDLQLRGHLLALIRKHERVSHERALRLLPKFFIDVRIPGQSKVTRQFRAEK